jgi:hypothetical protein
MKRTLTCPYCQAEIEVTWKRYWYSGTMLYHCPACSKRSRIATSPGWIQYTSWLVQLLPLAAILLTGSIYAVVVAIPAYIFIFTADKKLDERYGVLKKRT